MADKKADDIGSHDMAEDPTWKRRPFDLLLYGDPMVDTSTGAVGEAGGESACILCKRFLKGRTALAAHLASDEHAERASAAWDYGSLRLRSPSENASTGGAGRIQCEGTAADRTAHVLLTLTPSAGSGSGGSCVMVRAETQIVAVCRANYAIIGGGQTGLLFLHRCIRRGAGTSVLIEQRERLGGQWNDAYHFVRLHSPKATYGIDTSAWAGDVHHDLASRKEVLAHYDLAMRPVWQSERAIRLLGHSARVHPCVLGIPAVVATPVGRVRGATPSAPSLLVLADGIIDATINSIPWNINPAHHLGHAAIGPSGLPWVSEGVPEALSPPPAHHTPLTQLLAAVAEAALSWASAARMLCAPSNFLVIGGGKSGCDTILYLIRALGAEQASVRVTWVISRPLAFYRRPLSTDIDGAYARLLAQHREAAPGTPLAALPSYTELFHHYTDALPRTTHHGILGDDEMRQLRAQPNRVEGVRVVSVDGGVATLSDGRRLTCECTVVVSCLGPQLDEAANRKGAHASACMAAAGGGATAIGAGASGRTDAEVNGATLFPLSTTFGGYALDNALVADAYLDPRCGLPWLRRELRFMPFPPFGDEETFWITVECHEHNTRAYARAGHARAACM